MTKRSTYPRFTRENGSLAERLFEGSGMEGSFGTGKPKGAGNS